MLWLFFFFNIQATPEDITTAYRRLSRLYHPDKHPDPEQKHKADILFNKVKKAYEGKTITWIFSDTCSA